MSPSDTANSRVLKVFISPEQTQAVRDRLRRERLAMDLAEEGGWTTVVPRAELNLLHHSLRMLATHPMTEDREEVQRLADLLWEESVKRND